MLVKEKSPFNKTFQMLLKLFYSPVLGKLRTLG